KPRLTVFPSQASTPSPPAPSKFVLPSPVTVKWLLLKTLEDWFWPMPAVLA
ncbi:hypothetical protein AB1N83_011405, partial [Pleurotus pulmonarius]